MSKIVGNVFTFAYLIELNLEFFGFFFLPWLEGSFSQAVHILIQITWPLVFVVCNGKVFFNADTMSFDDTEIEETIKVCHDANDGYILCPHTAVAVKYFYKMKLDQSR